MTLEEYQAMKAAKKQQQQQQAQQKPQPKVQSVTVPPKIQEHEPKEDDSVAPKTTVEKAHKADNKKPAEIPTVVAEIDDWETQADMPADSTSAREENHQEDDNALTQK